MERGTIGRGSRCGRVDESYVESSQARRRVNIINQASFTDPKFSHMLSVILKNKFNGSWTTWKEVNKTAHDELWAHFKFYNPKWIESSYWEDMIGRVWNTAEWKTKSKSKRVNQLILKEASKHCVGSIIIAQHKRKLAMYKEAVVAKYGPDSSNHPIFDVDLWEYSRPNAGVVIELLDLIYEHVTKNAESTFSLSPRQMALWTSQREDHTSDWLWTVPISGIFVGDIYGDHAVSCARIIGIKHRHNVMRDTLVDICYRSGISASKEVNIGLDGGRDKPLRSANMLLYSWDGGLDVCGADWIFTFDANQDG
ncbi:hypothetical protein Tco_1237630 [Tanacetum coccineum]